MSGPVKVCHVIEATNGGVRRHVVDLLSNLPRELDVHVAHSLVRADDVWRAALAALDGRVTAHEIEMHRNISPRRDARSIAALARLFRRERFDVIHVHSGKGGLLGRVAAALSPGRPAVVYTPNASPFRLSRVYATVERALTHLTDAVIAVTPSEHDELTSERIAPPDGVRTIVSGIDAEPFEGYDGDRELVRRSLGIEPSDLVITSVGRMSAQKEPLAFLRAAARVAAEVPAVRIVWVGDGELRGAYEEEARRLGVEGRLVMPGYVDDVRPALAASDVFCLMSGYESLGYVTLEAMAMGLPAVGTHVAGTRDVIEDGVTGYLVDTGDDAAAAARMLELARNPGLRAGLGAAGRRRVRAEFSARAMAADTARLYAELAGSLATVSPAR